MELIAKAQEDVDFLGSQEKLSAFAQRQLLGLRERLIDLELLIEQKDFAEGLELSTSALQYAQNLRAASNANGST